MRSYELKATKENITKTFLDDSISRNSDIIRFAEILDAIEGNCSIALDGGWGSGKTFFVKQTKLLLDSFNDLISTDKPEERQKIINKCKRGNTTIAFPSYVSVYYDAWENDNDDDPVLSLVYSIINSLNADFNLSNISSLLKKAAAIMELFTDKSLSNLIDSFKSDSPLSKIKTSKNTEKLITDFFDSLLCERGNRLIIFIDELDRCKPSYAVRVLERMKHYFSNDRITFVFSINANELQHTIRQYYGDNFDACRYLDRFFDLRVSLPPLDLESYYKLLHFSSSGTTYDTICDAVLKTFHFEMREISRYIFVNQIAAYKVRHSTSIGITPREKSNQFVLTFILPIMIGLKMTDFQQYTDFIRGKDFSPLVDVYSSCDLRDAFCAPLLAPNESFLNEQGKTTVSLESKLKELYDAIFITAYGYTTNQATVGQYTFTQNTRDSLFKAASSLSKYAYANPDDDTSS
ncbi:MAG: KAP family NTPase [Clostridiales bacterium]|nr:KAP family NTPase [Clostridiales bacterium]